MTLTFHASLYDWTSHSVAPDPNTRQITVNSRTGDRPFIIGCAKLYCSLQVRNWPDYFGASLWVRNMGTFYIWIVVGKIRQMRILRYCEWERRPRWQRRWINEGDVVIGCFLCVTVFYKQTFVRCPLIFGDSVIQVFMFSELWQS